MGRCMHYQARPIDPARSAEPLAARSLSDPERRRFVAANAESRSESWPPPAWDLRALTLAASYFQPDLDVARARWSVARGGTITAGERPNRMLGASAGYNTMRGSLGVRGVQ